MMNTLSLLQDSGFLLSLDIHFARFAQRFSGDYSQEVGLAAALVSRFTREGHVCIDLTDLGDKEILPKKEGQEGLFSPHLEDWRRALQKSFFVGAPGDFRPLILDDGNRLYLHRYWKYQEALAAGIKERISLERDFDSPRAKAVLEILFPTSPREGTDWQKVAAFTALSCRFSVITGGPGTGKTTTVARLLALILELGALRNDRIALLSPTGKGAIRLREAMEVAKERLPVSERVKQSFPDNASTIHRLLGGRFGSSAFRYHHKNRLPLDMAIIDEASMADLPLMSNLVQALPDHAKLLLLGDRHQLSSVEPGAVLGDICDGGSGHHYSRVFQRVQEEVMGEPLPGTGEERRNLGLEDCIVHLQHNYRFEETSGIGSLSRAIKEGKGGEAVDILRKDRLRDVRFHAVPPSRELLKVMRTTLVRGFRGYLACKDPIESLMSFEDFRILCALREGPFGVRAVNTLVEACLEREGLILPNREWYPGRPVMITKNDYRLGLFNGDVGIAFPCEKGDLRVFFQSQEGTHRLFHPYMLPEHETTFAVTVHKSQGSEFDKVLFLLPDRDAPVLSRELLYTGITRARERVDLWGSVEVFEGAVKRRNRRRSGLRDLLWGT